MGQNLTLERPYTAKSLSDNLKPNFVSTGSLVTSLTPDLFPRTLVTIVCDTDQDPDAFQRNIFERQLNHTQTMLKSLLYFSPASFKVIVVTDSENTFYEVQNLIKEWPHSFSSRLHFERRQVWTPKAEGLLMEMWRPCSWAKLFLHEALPHVDAAVYVDTDILFTGPADGLWDILEDLEEPQSIAIGQDPLYDRHKHRRYAGTVGLSAGLLVTNFTRQRQFKSEHGSYTDTLMYYKNTNINSHDQDTLNAFLADYPDTFYELSPQWMFCPSQCLRGVIPCCLDTGVNVIHGFDATFVRGIEMIFQVIYESFQEVAFEAPPSALKDRLESEFARVDSRVLPSTCRKVMGIQDILGKHIRDLAAGESISSTTEWYKYMGMEVSNDTRKINSIRKVNPAPVIQTPFIV